MPNWEFFDYFGLDALIGSKHRIHYFRPEISLVHSGHVVFKVFLMHATLVFIDRSTVHGQGVGHANRYVANTRNEAALAPDYPPLKFVVTIT